MQLVVPSAPAQELLRANDGPRFQKPTWMAGCSSHLRKLKTTSVVGEHHRQSHVNNLHLDIVAHRLAWHFSEAMEVAAAAAHAVTAGLLRLASEETPVVDTRLAVAAVM